MKSNRGKAVALLSLLLAMYFLPPVTIVSILAFLLAIVVFVIGELLWEFFVDWYLDYRFQKELKRDKMKQDPRKGDKS